MDTYREYELLNDLWRTTGPVEKMVSGSDVWRDRPVLVTGR